MRDTERKTWLEEQKERFRDHVATFTDYGNIKILDFKKPDSSEYRIRFLFEEDYYRLHISGDLGSLVATNYCNMCWEWFYKHYTGDIGYFNQKIDCCERDIYGYDEAAAKEDLKNRISESELEDDVCLMYPGTNSPDEAVEKFIEDVLEDYSWDRGMGSSGYEMLSRLDLYAFEYASSIGKKSTGILDLYMLAFRLAADQILGRQVVHEMSAFDKYRWHDLRENAEDLPELDKRVLVCYQIDDATYGYVTWWTDEDDLFSPIVEAIAWSYIDLYEGK